MNMQTVTAEQISTTCTCSARGASARSKHRKPCPGRLASGWRARVPVFLHEELERATNGVPIDTPVFRSLALHRAKVAGVPGLVKA